MVKHIFVIVGYIIYPYLEVIELRDHVHEQRINMEMNILTSSFQKNKHP